MAENDSNLDCQKIFDKKYELSENDPLINGFKDILNDYETFRKCAKNDAEKRERSERKKGGKLERFG